MGSGGCGGSANPLSIDQSSEIQIGQQGAADIERQYGVVNDPVQTPRIQRIGRAIAAVSQRPELPWSFKILNMSDVNALSLPGGPVYVTRGLLNTRLTDAELAGVLGHEIAHINERHAVKAIQQQMTYQLLSEVVLGRSAAATQQAANLAVQLAVELPNSRKDEYQADAIGTRLAYNAGYPAGGLVQFLTLLQSISGPNSSPAWLQTHPLTSDRIARAQQSAAEISGQPRPVPLVLSRQNEQTLQQLVAEDADNAVKHAK
jgi:predicted Zn-dependent protease